MAHAHRVLVIAYYFPPMGLSGVQRVSKFVKYLPDYGWEPVVLTVDPGGYFAYDPTLLEELEERDIEILRTRSVDPTSVFGRKKTVQMPREKSRSALSKMSQMVFVPDNKIGWKRYAVQLGRKLLDTRRFHVVFSSAPPYTAHLIASELSDYANLPMVTDFRDDWVGNPRHFYASPMHRALHKRLERKVMRESAHVITINRHIKENLIGRNLGAEGYHKTTVIPHGFDPEDFPDSATGPAHGARMRWVYSGVFYDAQQPDTFLKAFGRVLEQRPELRDKVTLEFFGLMPDSGRKLIKQLALEDVVDCKGYVDHRIAVEGLRNADVLWMTIGEQDGAEMISTSKLYEYFGSGKPVLALVPEGTARQELERYGAARIADPNAGRGAEDAITDFISEWEAGSLPKPDRNFIGRFDRSMLTGELARIFHSVQAHD